MINSKLLEMFPELGIPDVATMYHSNKRLTELGQETTEDMVDCAIMRMANMNGGIGYFWQPEDAKAQFICWVNGLKYCTMKQIFHTVFQVLSGKTEKTPRTPMEFMRIMNNGIHHQLAPSVQETNTNHARLGFDGDAARTRSNDARIRAMELMRDSLPPVKPRNG